MSIAVVGKIEDVQTIAEGTGIREINRLRRTYGKGSWKKKKGIALVRLEDQTVCRAEIHWYEAHGIGRKEIRIKRNLD